LNTALQGAGWPAVGQVIRLERGRKRGGKRTVAVAYYLSSLTPTQAPPEHLLRWIRRHWEIENRLHYVKDQTLREDACRVRKGNAAQVLAALRNVAVHLLESVPAASKAAATRRLQAHPLAALSLLQT
jgi:predicted transposase YbfD/YdcC